MLGAIRSTDSIWSTWPAARLRHFSTGAGGRLRLRLWVTERSFGLGRDAVERFISAVGQGIDDGAWWSLELGSGLVARGALTQNVRRTGVPSMPSGAASTRRPESAGQRERSTRQSAAHHRRRRSRGRAFLIRRSVVCAPVGLSTSCTCSSVVPTVYGSQFCWFAVSYSTTTCSIPDDAEVVATPQLRGRRPIATSCDRPGPAKERHSALSELWPGGCRSRSRPT